MDDLKDGVYITERFKKLLGVGRSEQDMWTRYGKNSLTTRYGAQKVEKES